MKHDAMFVIPFDLDLAELVFLDIAHRRSAEKILQHVQHEAIHHFPKDTRMYEPRRVQFPGNEDGAYSPVLQQYCYMFHVFRFRYYCADGENIFFFTQGH